MIQEASTLPELLTAQALAHPKDTALWHLDDSNKWSPISFQDFHRQVLDLAWALKSQGINQADTVAIMASTGLEWELIHHALLMLGAIVVGIDPEETSEQLEHIVPIAKVEVLILDHAEKRHRFSLTTQEQLRTIIHFRRPLTDNHDELIYLPVPLPSASEPEPLPNRINPDDIATIVFTSGTTGIPKGIAYRHTQIIAAIAAILVAYPELSQRPCHLVCWLPLSNLFQRMINLCAIASGAEVYFVGKPQQIIDYLPQINPHIFIAVPRFYEKLYQSLEAKLDNQSRIPSRLLRLCLDLGERNSGTGQLFRAFNRRLFRRFRSLFGKNIRFVVSGSAPLPLRVLKRFYAMDIIALEAYGLSENVIPVAANRLTEFCFGSVGKPLNGNTVLIAEDGELLIKGEGVFEGYLGKPEFERQRTAEGYLATGDYAEIDEQGFIHLRGRKSELFKTSTGRKIAPVAIETALRRTPGVEHAVVFGEGKKFLVTLLTTSTPNQCDETNTQTKAREVAATISEHLASLPHYQRPAGVILSFTPLSIQHQELTSTMKVRRQHVYKRYETAIEQLYQALEDPDALLRDDPLVIEPGLALLKL